jgi:hypothetical protein
MTAKRQPMTKLRHFEAPGPYGRAPWFIGKGAA